MLSSQTYSNKYRQQAYLVVIDDAWASTGGVVGLEGDDQHNKKPLPFCSCVNNLMYFFLCVGCIQTYNYILGLTPADVTETLPKGHAHTCKSGITGVSTFNIIISCSRTSALKKKKKRALLQSS